MTIELLMSNSAGWLCLVRLSDRGVESDSPPGLPLIEPITLR